MNKVLVGIFAAFLLIAAASVPAHAQNAIRVENENVDLDFPNLLTFSLDATAPSNLESATLVVRFPEVTRRLNAKFTPATNVNLNVEWVLDTDSSTADGGYLPPGTLATYSWQLKDAAGNTFETESRELEIRDNRLTWRTLENADIELNWYGPGEAWGQDVFDDANAMLATIRQQLGAENTGRTSIWLYTEREDFRSSSPNMNEWTGGRSYGDYRSIALFIGDPDPREAMGLIRHELTHQIAHDALGNGLASEAMPHWFNEGLATYNESNGEPLRGDLAEALQTAIESDTLPRLKGLDANFSPDSYEASVSYGMSYAVVDLMFRKFGKAKVTELFGYWKDAMPTDDGLVQALGVDTNGLENLFREEVGLPARDFSGAGIPTAVARPTYGLSLPETPVPAGQRTATPQSVAVANTPAPAATSASSQQSSGNSGASTGLCGGVLGGLALAMVGAYGWRRRRGEGRD